MKKHFFIIFSILLLISFASALTWNIPKTVVPPTNLTPYALLNGSNQPFTGDINVSKTNPQESLGGFIFGQITSSNTGYIKNTNVQPAMSATGGTITSVGGYTIHSFTSNGTFTVTGSGTVEYLIVGGGGGGANGGGGGGGAGGVLNGSVAVSSGDYTIIIGSGGAIGAKGGNSSFNSIVAVGGGFGGQWDTTAGSGGSGGGAARFGGPGSGIAGQGYNGGSQGTSSYWGNGGGGWGEIGGTDGQRFGGDGLINNITGTPTYYGGGGGGSSISGAQCVAGGDGGGGQGCINTNGGAGTDGLGGGGGASGYGVSGVGGSGVIVIRYSSSSSLVTSNVLTATDGVSTGESGIYNLGNTGSRTNIIGQIINLNLSGINKLVVNSSGAFWSTAVNMLTSLTLGNNIKLFFGTASIFNDGTDLIINASAGALKLFNNLNMMGNNIINATNISSSSVFATTINSTEINTSNINAKTENITGNVYIEGNLSVKRPYGMFSSTQTQTVAVINTAYPVTFNWTEDNYQVYKASDNTNFSFGQTGDYLIELSIIAQGGQGDKAEIWIQKNGVNVPRSNTIYDFKGTNANAVIAVPFIIDMNMTDSFRVMYAGSSTNVKLQYTTNTSYSPETPSCIMSITKISEISP